MMSLAIVLMGWVAASLILSPVIGRFMSMQDQGESLTGPRQIPSSGPYASVRRNVAIQLPRRDASWTRFG